MYGISIPSDPTPSTQVQALPPTKSGCPYKIIPASEGGGTYIWACLHLRKPEHAPVREQSPFNLPQSNDAELNISPRLHVRDILSTRPCGENSSRREMTLSLQDSLSPSPDSQYSACLILWAQKNGKDQCCLHLPTRICRSPISLF